MRESQVEAAFKWLADRLPFEGGSRVPAVVAETVPAHVPNICSLLYDTQPADVQVWSESQAEAVLADREPLEGNSQFSQMLDQLYSSDDDSDVYTPTQQ